MRARLAVLALAAVLLAGCGEKPEPPASRVTSVTGTVDLKQPATTKHSALAFGGHVEPASAQVLLRRAGHAAAAVPVGADGDFRARARKLKHGRNRFVLEGRSVGLAPWKVDLTISRK